MKNEENFLNINDLKTLLGHPNCNKVRMQFTLFIFLIGLASGKIINPSSEHSILMSFLGLFTNFKDNYITDLIDITLLQN